MNPPIEAPPGKAYRASMRSLLLRLIALTAVLLLPLGMSGAPAAGHHGHAAASMTMEHCPHHGSNSASKVGFAECTMACSAALPAAELPRDAMRRAFAAPVILASAHVLRGLHPETATPPPKTA